MHEEGLIDSIYEAAIVTQSWPALLGKLAVHAKAKGGLLLASNQDGVSWVTAPEITPLYEEFVAQGWHLQNDRIPRLISRGHAGFLTDNDVYTEREIASLPMYTQFLKPIGFDAAAATTMPGLADDALVLSVEGFASAEASRAAVPMLDRLRPHLARASMLAAQLGLERASAAVSALELIGAPAAILTAGRRLLAANGLFQSRLDWLGHDTPKGLRLVDPRADARLGQALAALRSGAGHGISLALKPKRGPALAVLHVLPLRGTARDIFSGATAVLTLATPGVRHVPGADLIQNLLDLTPAEARLARDLAAGVDIAKAAARAGVRETTVRTQIRSIYMKTGVCRLADLVALLINIGPPGD